MRKAFLMALMIISGILFSTPGYSKNDNKFSDSIFIYVYRVGQFSGAAANWAVFLDEEKKCKLSNNKYMRLTVTPGKHKVSAKIGGVGLLKKETEVEIDAEAGGSYFIACNVKQSITRARLELIEVTKNTANKQMEKMSMDNCQENQE